MVPYEFLIFAVCFLAADVMLGIFIGRFIRFGMGEHTNTNVTTLRKPPFN